MDSAPYKMLYSDKYDLYTEQYKTTFCFQLNLFESNLGRGGGEVGCEKYLKNLLLTNLSASYLSNPTINCMHIYPHVTISL